MKGVSYITDEKNRRKAVVIDLKILEKGDKDMYDLLDVLVAEVRKDAPKRKWEIVKKSLERKRKR